MREGLIFPGFDPLVSRIIPPMREDSPMSKLSLTLAAVAASTTFTPAFAQDDDVPRVAVRYDDLNLDSASGRKRLDLRVRVAIRDLCDTRANRDLKFRAASLECEAQAKRSIEPQLAALYNGASAKFASDKPPVVAAP